jgi:RNA polymerase sigma-70 factor (ECF subfamily)
VAFIEIYRRYRDWVYRFACRMMGSAEVARDITHICFASPRDAVPVRRESVPATYQPRRATRACDAAARGASGRPGRRRTSGPPWPEFFEVLLEAERARVVREVLATLAPLHRELILVEYEDFDLATVAEIVGVEVGAVKVRLHRVRRKLRAALEVYVKRGALVVE